MIIEIPEKITFCEFAGHKHTIKDDSFLIVDNHQILSYRKETVGFPILSRCGG